MAKKLNLQEMCKKKTSLEARSIRILMLAIVLLSVFLLSYEVNAVGTIPNETSLMVAHHHFNNQSAYGENSTFVYDFASVHINNATCTAGSCPIWNNTGGYLGDGAYEFNGLNSYFSIVDNDNLSVINYANNETTFSIWFRINPDVNGSTANGLQYIFSKGNGANYEYNLYKTNSTGSNVIAFQMFSLSGSANTATLLTGYENNTWYHAIIVINASYITPYIFLSNNTLISNTPTTRTQVWGNGNAQFQFGKRQDLGTGIFNGSIDEFIIFNRQLSRREIWDLHLIYVDCVNISNIYYPIGNVKICNPTGNQILNYAGDTNGAVQINTVNDTFFDCNGVILNGTNETNYIGINIFRRSNTTLRNCTFTNYYYATKIVSSTGILDNNNYSNNFRGIFITENGFNGTIKNSIFNNNSYASIWLSAVNSSYLNITNNTFYNWKPAIYDEPSNNNFESTFISSNIFYQYVTTKAISTHTTSTGWVIDGNTLYGVGLAGSYGFDIRGNNTIVKNNVLNKCQYAINIVSRFNTTILNNTINSADEGVQVYNSDNVFILNNSFRNITANYDGYDTGNKIKHSTNVYVRFNNFSEIATTGLFAQNSSNITIEGNYFYTIPISSRSNYPAKDYGDPVCAISIVELYKSYLGNGEEAGNTSMNIATIGRYKSSNITLLTNTFDANTKCYLRTEGTGNLSHDLTNYWYRKFNTPFGLKDNMEFWINSSYSNISSYYGSPTSEKYQITSTFYGANQMEYILTNFSLFLNNTNRTQTYISTVFNLSNAYIYYSNHSLHCSDISTCDGDINITLAPQNYSYVFDNFYNYPVFINNSFYNSSTYETENENFNITIFTLNPSLASAYLVYNGTMYSATLVNSTSFTATFSKSIDIPTISGGNWQNINFYWAFRIYNDTAFGFYNTSTSYQNVSAITFASCNSSFIFPFINYTFKDVTTLASINATIPNGLFYYYLGSGGVKKSYSYANTTENNFYHFCFSEPSQTLNVAYQLLYGSSGYEATNYYETTSLSSVVTDKVLYLLNSSFSHQVTFMVINTAEQPLSDVYINITRNEGGVQTSVAAAYTDVSGAASFFLDPLYAHTITFNKTGYDLYTITVYPSENFYTINLGTVTNTTIYDYIKGVAYLTYPQNQSLINNTFYDFKFVLTSSIWDVSEFGFILKNGSGSIIASNSSNTNGGSVSLNINTLLNKSIRMEYYWVINGNYSNASRLWVVNTGQDTEWSIWQFFQDFQTYLSAGLFGLDNFGFALIIFFVVFLSTGFMIYKFGITSPSTIAIFIFGVVAFLDVGIGILPAFAGQAVAHFITIMVGIVTAGIVIQEVSR